MLSSKNQRIKSKIIHYFIITLVILAPAFITSLLVRLYFGASLYDFFPGASNDEMDYWYETFTFSKVGFKGGYQTFEEHPALAKFSHFESHGPMYPMVYGTLARIFGWHTHSAPLFNLAFVTLAVLIFIYVVKPNRKQLVMLGLVLVTFWPLLLFLPTNMQEALHQAIAIILAAMFYRLISSKDQVSFKFKYLFFFLILFASLFRPTWSFLFIPFFVLFYKDKSIRNLSYGILKGTLWIIISFLVSFYWNAPYPNEFLTRVAQLLTASIPNGIHFFLVHAKSNLIRLASLHKVNALEILQKYQILYLLLLYTIVGIYLWICELRKKELGRLPETKWEILFQLYNLGIILIAVVLFYDVSELRDYRVCAPYLLVTLLLLVALDKKSWLVGLIIFSNLIFISFFQKTYKERLLNNFIYDRQSVVSFQKSVKDLIVYKENSNPWCNTLLSFILPEPLPYQYAGLPPGLGVSYVYFPKQLQTPIKSKYLLLDTNGYGFLNGKTNIKLLGKTPLGNLFLNLDSECSSQ
jgi:hypothetical protein